MSIFLVSFASSYIIKVKISVDNFLTQVFRAMDPGLVHIYHDRGCSPKLPAAQYRMCIDSSSETYGSKQQLAKKLTALENLHSLTTTTTKSPLAH